MKSEAKEAARQIALSAPELLESLEYTGELLIETIARARPVLNQPAMQAAAELLTHLEGSVKALERLKDAIEASERSRANLN